MAEIGDVVEMRDVQTYQGVNVNNVYHYRINAIGTGTLGQRVLEIFTLRLWPRIILLQHESLSHDAVVWVNLNNLTEFGTEVPAPAVTGSLQQEANVSFNAIKIRLNRETRLTRNGFKRIGGLDEAVTTGNTINPAFAADAALMGTEMGVNQTIGGWIFQPVIYGRETGPPNNLPIRVNNVVAGITVGVTSQSSRK